MRYNFRTKNVCAMEIGFDLDGDTVSNIQFTGGCNGNLKAISKLLEGTNVDFIESRLRGNKCGFKDTSCADQLAIAVRKAYEESKAQ